VPGFPRSARLRQPPEFKRVLAAGRRLHEPLLTAVIKTGGTDGPRLGLAIAARAVPTAVARNRIKRQTRESFRLHRERLPPLDIVILARAGAAKASRAELRDTLERLWNKACAVSPASS
jgi:ribonuclease P protein component